MTQHRDLNYGNRFPEAYSDALEEFISTLLVNFKLTLLSATTLQIVAGADNAQVGAGINGRWRYISASITAAHPGGVAGTYPVFVTASDNSFAPSGAPPGSNPETDSTNYNFGLLIAAIAGVPGTALYRQVASVVWDGAKITRIIPVAGNLPLNIADLVVVTPESAARNTMTPSADFIMQTFKRIAAQTADLTRWNDETNTMLAAVDVHGTFKTASGFMLPSLTLTAINALPAGSRPAALVVFNSDSALAYINVGSDATPNWRPVGRLASDVNQRGTIGARPAASAVDIGTTYLATDANGGTTYRSTGAAWEQMGAPVGQTGVASRAGTLAAIPGAGTVDAGTEYLATDDHGGQAYRSNGAVWTKKGPPSNGEWPLGACVDWPWAAGSIPAYTALPYAQNLAAATYVDLATMDTAAGHPHGTSGGNIVMPDYRGRAGIGKDDMGGSAASRITLAISGVSGATLGGTFGAEGITLTTGQLPAHNHGVTGSPGMSDPGHRHDWLTGPGGGSIGHLGPSSGASHSYQDIIDGASGINNSSTGITVNVGSLGTANAGSGSAHQNTQPSIIVNKIMRVL